MSISWEKKIYVKMLFAQGKITSWTKKNLPVNCLLLSHNGAQWVEILFQREFIKILAMSQIFRNFVKRSLWMSAKVNINSDLQNTNICHSTFCQFFNIMKCFFWSSQHIQARFFVNKRLHYSNLDGVLP